MRSVFVKATSNCPNKNEESKLSVDDMIVVRMMVNQTIFYDYIIPEETLESAMGKIVERYPEAAGRFSEDQKCIKLINEGAVINFMNPSTLSLEELKLKNFNYKFCWQNFIPDNRNFMHVPFIVTVRTLADNSGMVLQFDTNHLLGDINASFLLVADFCSQVKNGCFHFEKVIERKRCDYFVTSGNPPKFGHPEFLVFDQFPAIDLPPENPSELTNATIDQATLKQLKNYVYETASKNAIEEMTKLGAMPSTNDCLVGLMHKAFVETRPKDEPIPDVGYPLTVALNLRPRRVPPIPEYHFGNMLGVLTNYFTKESIGNASLFDVAAEVRKSNLKYTEEFVQSCVDFLTPLNYYQFFSLFIPTSFNVSNWNKQWDWYAQTDLGKGSPIKFASYLAYLDRNCAIVPSREPGGLEINLGITKSQMDKFKNHPDIKKYLKFDD